jgi:nucleoside-diphosphate-sugar epimerase
LKKKTILLTGTTGFIGFNFLKYALSQNYNIIDILRIKNFNNTKIKKIRELYPKKYKTIFFSSYHQIQKKLQKVDYEYFINFATLYKNNHNYNDIFSFINSNILFPTLIYESIHLKAKKTINFGSMMQIANGKNYNSQNLYAASKNAFEMIENFYLNKASKSKFYNLKIYESFGEDDNRPKLIPTILKNYKEGKLTRIISKKLELNIVHIEDIIQAIMILLNDNIKSGSYCLKNKKNIKIYNLISKINKKLTKKIKIKYKNNILNKIKKTNLKKLPKWKPDLNLEKKIEREFFK